MSVTEAGRLHSGASLSNTKEPGSTQHPPPPEENRTRREIDDLKAKVDELQRIITSRDIPRVVEERLEKVESEISTIKTQLEPIMKLETQMTAGFTSLDNRLSMMCDMFAKDREDRLARQLERDKSNATDQTTNPRARTQGSGTQPSQQQRRNETEAPKKTTKS